MRFEELNDTVPLARYGKEKVLTMKPYPNITLAMPGRHAEDTTPKGGDFVVMVKDPLYKSSQHQFTHTDIFNDVQVRLDTGAADMHNYLEFYLGVVAVGAEPKGAPFTHVNGCILPQTFFYAIQCLAVAEHRRYAKYENKFGGRFLPFRFAAGIAEGLWTADDASALQKRGRPGVEWLEKDKGLPALTKVLTGG